MRRRLNPKFTSFAEKTTQCQKAKCPQKSLHIPKMCVRPRLPPSFSPSFLFAPLRGLGLQCQSCSLPVFLYRVRSSSGGWRHHFRGAIGWVQHEWPQRLFSDTSSKGIYCVSQLDLWMRSPPCWTQVNGSTFPFAF